MRREVFEFCDLVRLILDILRYMWRGTINPRGNLIYHRGLPISDCVTSGNFKGSEWLIYVSHNFVRVGLANSVSVPNHYANQLSAITDDTKCDVQWRFCHYSHFAIQGKALKISSAGSITRYHRNNNSNQRKHLKDLLQNIVTRSGFFVFPICIDDNWVTQMWVTLRIETVVISSPFRGIRVASSQKIL